MTEPLIFQPTARPIFQPAQSQAAPMVFQPVPHDLAAEIKATSREITDRFQNSDFLSGLATGGQQWASSLFDMMGKTAGLAKKAVERQLTTDELVQHAMPGSMPSMLQLISQGSTYLADKYGGTPEGMLSLIETKLKDAAKSTAPSEAKNFAQSLGRMVGSIPGAALNWTVAGPIGLAAGGAVEGSDQGLPGAALGAAQGATTGMFFKWLDGMVKPAPDMTGSQSGPETLGFSDWVRHNYPSAAGEMRGPEGIPPQPVLGKMPFPEAPPPNTSAEINASIKAALKARGASQSEAELRDVLASTSRSVQAPSVSRETVSPDIAQKAADFLNKDLSTVVPAEKYAGNINLNHLNGPEDFKKATTFLVEQQFGGFQDARYPQDPVLINKAIVQAKRAIFDQTRMDLMDKRAAAIGGNDADLTAFLQAFQRHAAAGEEVAGVAAEAGRTLQVFNEIPKSQKLAAARMKEIIDGFGGRPVAEFTAQRLLDLTDPAQIDSFVKDAAKATTWGRLVEGWISGLLSGPKTWLVNINGNFAGMATGGAEGYATALVSKIPGIGSGEGGFAEANARVAGMLRAQGEAARAGFKTFMTEESPDMLGRFDVGRQKQIPGALGKTIRTGARVLEGSDVYAKMVNYSGELHALAVRDGVNNQKLGGDALGKYVDGVVASPPEEIKAAAWEYARKFTYTNQLGGDWLTLGAKQIRDYANKVPLFQLVTPFVRTMANIQKFALERTPLALTFGDVREAIKAGGIQRDQALARIAMGSTLGAAWAVGKYNGLITGSGAKNKAERDIKGMVSQPNSLKIGDTYYDYSWMDPLASHIGLSADLVDVVGYAKQGELNKAAALISMSIANNMLSKNYAKSTSDLLQALGGDNSKWETFFTGMVSSVVPQLLARTAAAADPYMRDTKSILERIQSRIPGVRENYLQIGVNLWGQDIKPETIGFPAQIANPVYMKTDPHDKVINEMIRLEFYPGMPERKIGGIDLTPQQYRDYVVMAGQPAKERLDVVVGNDQWKTMGPGIQKKFLSEIIQGFRQNAAEMMQVKYPDLMKQIQAKQIQSYK